MPLKFRLVASITFFRIMTSFPYSSFIRHISFPLLFHISLLQNFPTMTQQPPHYWSFTFRLRQLQSLRLLWTSDQHQAETSNSTAHNINNRQTSMSPRWDSNPRSQQAFGRRPTP